MQITEILSTIFKDRITGYVFITAFLFGTSYFTYLGSTNNLEVARRLDVFQERVIASEGNIEKNTEKITLNDKRITVLEITLTNIQDTVNETKQDVKDIRNLFIKVN